MKKLYILFTFLFCLSCLQTAQAQSLAEITAQKDFALRAPKIQEEPSSSEEETPIKQQETLLQVNKLPDIKLNEDILRSSVIDYKNNPNLQEAFNLYKQGKTDETLKILEEDSSAEALINAALIYLQKGSYAQALKAVNKAQSIEDNAENPFYQLIKIWIYAAQNNYIQAQKEYQKLLFLTADFEYVYNAKLALATSAFFTKKYKDIAPLLENIYSSNPYIISHAAYLIGRVLFNKKAYLSAQTLLSQALTHDNNNYSALLHYALSQEKLKQFVPAWQSFANILILDPQDKFALNKTTQLAKYLKNKPSTYLFYVKLDELFSKEVLPSQGQLVRVGLFSNKKGSLEDIQEFIFNAESDFVIEEEKLGIVLSAAAFNNKYITFNPETSSIDINNKWGHKEFSTKRPFAIKLKKNGSTFLIKEPLSENVFKTNLGDKELKGTLLVIPTEKGMQLINYTALEDILPSLLTPIAKGQKDQNTLQALAIILRTQILKLLEQSHTAIFDLPDNTKNFFYGGINLQSAANVQAVKETQNQVLINKENKTLAFVPYYQSCSYITAEGFKNTENDIQTNYTFSPVNLFKYMISNPPKDLISAPQDPTQWSRIKWLYMFPLKEMQTRLNFSFKELATSKMDNYGRIEEMAFKTKNETKELPFEEASFILSLGTLRSNFFFYIPVNKGQEYLFLGTDTGLGKGLCIDGLVNFSKQGKTYLETLNYYYPDFEVSQEWQNEKLLL